MEPKGWLLWKGQICLQFLQLTHQRKRDGDIGWVMQTQKEGDREEKEERVWEGELKEFTQRYDKDGKISEGEVNRRCSSLSGTDIRIKKWSVSWWKHISANVPSALSLYIQVLILVYDFKHHNVLHHTSELGNNETDTGTKHVSSQHHNGIVTPAQIIIVFQCTHILYSKCIWTIFWSCEIIPLITCIIPCRNNINNTINRIFFFFSKVDS